MVLKRTASATQQDPDKNKTDVFDGQLEAYRLWGFSAGMKNENHRIDEKINSTQDLIEYKDKM